MTSLTPASSPPSPIPFAFKNHQIRTVVNDDGAPWFVAKDVCGALGLKWQNGDKTLSSIPSEWRRVCPLGGGITPTPKTHGGIRPKTPITIISEPAVYKLAFRSNKPEADEFTNWVASVVLPSIRKTGTFEAKALPSTITPAQQQELQNIVAAKSSAFPKEALGRVRAQIWSRLHNNFKVAKYDQLPHAKFPEAVEYLVRMEVRAELPSAEPKSDAIPALMKGLNAMLLGMIETQDMKAFTVLSKGFYDLAFLTAGAFSKATK